MENIENKIQELLNAMSLEEKIFQLTMKDLNKLEIDNNKVTQKSLEELFQGQSYGTLQCPLFKTSLEDISIRIATAQKYLKNSTPHAIPAIPLTEGLHGLLAPGSTIFPQSIALGSSWNPALVHDMAEVIAKEASACGVKQLLSPVLDVIRDHRWGRVEECYSEDPYLTSEFGVAFVTGAQGSVSQTRNGLDNEHVACTAKHFIGYSMPLRGINLGPTLFGEREIRSTFLEPFEKAIKEANIYSVMPSYSEIDGEPVHASQFLLGDILRGELGFKGYTISDYLALNMLIEFQKVAINKKDAALQALTAGVDLEAPDFDSYKHIPELVESGKLSLNIVDNAVANVLRIKFKSGLFDQDFTDFKENVIHTDKHVALSRKLAEESIILLKNSNSILPLDGDKLKRLAVIGPNADRVQFGDYCWTNNKKFGVTVFEGLKSTYSENVEIVTTPGCDIWRRLNSNIGAATKIATDSDAVVLVLGGSSLPLGGVGWEIDDPENMALCGEGYDRDNLTPPGCQMELFDAIYATGKPIIVVLLHGRPWAIPEIAKKADAIIEAWYPGEQGGNAIADIISGKINPSGRLAVSLPRSVGQMPLYYNQKPSGSGYYHEPGSKDKPGRDYVFETPAPLYPFGYGLSYTEFEYSKMKLSAKKISLNDELEVKISIKNIGPREGYETVQLYVNDLVSSITTPVKVLRDFKKVKLAPGKTVVVKFTLAYNDFALWNRQMQKVVEAGEFKIMIGSSSENIEHSKIIELIFNNK